MTTPTPLTLRVSIYAKLGFFYMQTRRAGWAVLSLAGVAVFMAGLRFLMRQIDAEGRNPFTNAVDGSPSTFVLFFMPLVMAMVVGVAMQGPFGEFERTVSCPLPPLRLAHSLGLLLFGLITLVLLALTWDGHPTLVFLRNLAGFAGLAFIGSSLLGGRVSWLLPFAYGIVAFWIATSGELQWWVWPLKPSTDTMASIVALALCGGGLAVASLFGARDAPAEVG